MKKTRLSHMQPMQVEKTSPSLCRGRETERRHFLLSLSRTGELQRGRPHTNTWGREGEPCAHAFSSAHISAALSVMNHFVMWRAICFVLRVDNHNKKTHQTCGGFSMRPDYLFGWRCKRENMNQDRAEEEEQDSIHSSSSEIHN